MPRACSPLRRTWFRMASPSLEELSRSLIIASARFDFFFPRVWPMSLCGSVLYMSISCQKDICTRTQKVHKSRQIKTNQKTHKTHNQDDPQIPQPDLRFVKKKQQTRHTTGQEPKQQNHKKDLPRDTADFPLCHTQKPAKLIIHHDIP